MSYYTIENAKKSLQILSDKLRQENLPNENYITVEQVYNIIFNTKKEILDLERCLIFLRGKKNRKVWEQNIHLDQRIVVQEIYKQVLALRESLKITLNKKIKIDENIMFKEK